VRRHGWSSWIRQGREVCAVFGGLIRVEDGFDPPI
jgi:hypothetical protein